MYRAAKEFEHSVVNFVSSNSSAGVCDKNHSPKCKSFTYSYKCLLFIDVTSAVHATAWRSLLDGKQPTVFDNDIDTGTKPTEDVLFHRFKYFFHEMIACEHSRCNDQKTCLFHYYSGGASGALYLKSVPPHFTFGPPVAAYIQYCILKMWPLFWFLAPLFGFWPPCY